jgi:hypothetical protein
MATLLSQVRAQRLDKFYTRREVAKECLDSLGSLWPWDSWSLVVEPSAGNGSFYLQIPTQKKVGLDVAPDHPQIQTADFFSWQPPPGTQKILVVGNPPFGRVSSLAIRFFLRAAEFADVIAFIVPRTFRRISVQEKLPLNFHLRLDKDIPLHPCAFEPAMNVKCCWQIWERRGDKRIPIVLETTHPHWKFLEGPEGAEFAIRAYGGKCGEICPRGTEEFSGLAVRSWHWIQGSQLSAEELILRFSALDYSCSENTARQNSIGRAELIRLYKGKY